jgi:hypothetical protein
MTMNWEGLGSSHVLTKALSNHLLEGAEENNKKETSVRTASVLAKI